MIQETKTHRYYGRRKTRKLRPGLQQLMETDLPGLLLPKEKSFSPKGIFSSPVDKIWLEIGFGHGEHIAHQAKANSNIGFLGIEPFVNGIASLVRKIEENNLSNIKIFDNDARLLLKFLPRHSIDRVFMLFSDPWPKEKHHKRRLFSHHFLDQIKNCMKPESKFVFASDNMSYIRSSLKILCCRTDFIWEPESSKDWNERPRGSIETRYEAKARKFGRKNIYLSFYKV